MKREHSLDLFAARLLGAINARNSASPAAENQAEGQLQNFDSLALELFKLQFETNQVYRNFCTHRGVTPADIDHWRSIPSVPTSAFKDTEVSCIPPAARAAVFFSSGTTEQRPSRNYHHQDSLKVYEASLVAGFELAAGGGIPFKETACLALTPSKTQAPNSSLVHMFDTFRRDLGFTGFAFTGGLGPDGSWVLDCEATVEHLRGAMARGQPALLLGTAFSYVHLLDFMEQYRLRLRLPPGSRLLETGGYKGRSRAVPKSELHSLMEKGLGVSHSAVICEYGMSELSSQAYEMIATDQPPGFEARGFRFSPWARAQVISPETGCEVAEGQTGLIRIIDLANVFSVLSIQTEDLAVRQRNAFSLIGRAAQTEPRGCSLLATP